MRKWILVTLLLAAVILVGVFALADPFRREVLAAKAVRGPAVDAVTGTLEVLAFYEVTLETDIQGRLKDYAIELNGKVEEGDLVAELESRELRLQRDAEQIRLEAARAVRATGFVRERDVESLEAELARLEELASYGEASERQVEQVRRDLEKSRIALAQERIRVDETIAVLEKQIERLDNQIDRMKIHSPFEGTLSEMSAARGDYLFPGQGVARILSPGVIVLMTLSEEDFANVAIGQPATLYFASLPDREVRAEVETIALKADAGNRTRDITLKVPPEAAALLAPGMTGEGVLLKTERPDAVIVPRRALRGRELYVVSAGRIERRRVTPGLTGLNKAEIAEGIEPGEWVVLEGQSELADGQAVTLRPASAEE